MGPWAFLHHKRRGTVAIRPISTAGVVRFVERSERLLVLKGLLSGLSVLWVCPAAHGPTDSVCGVVA